MNTSSNSNMIKKRNAIAYTTLDSEILESQTVAKIISMKDVQFSGGLFLHTLSVDAMNAIGLNDMVANVVATLGDNTVSVPNTRSFLSKDIDVHNVRPLTFSYDVELNGSNSTNNAHEESIRLDASTEKVNITKKKMMLNSR